MKMVITEDVQELLFAITLLELLNKGNTCQGIDTYLPIKGIAINGTFNTCRECPFYKECGVTIRAIAFNPSAIIKQLLNIFIGYVASYIDRAMEELTDEEQVMLYKVLI